MTEDGIINITAVTNRGLVRDLNEDAIIVDRWVRTRSMTRPIIHSFPRDERVLAAVSDGMGGHAAGSTASLMVATRLAESGRDLVDGASVEEVLVTVNEEIYDAMEANPSLIAMGATVAGLIVDQDRLLYFNVGDSRVYRFRNGFLRQLTHDDSGTRPGEVTQALGGVHNRVEIQPHVAESRLLVDQGYLICSDGLSDVLDLDTMETRLRQADDLQAVSALLEDALAQEAPDNVSIVLIRIDGAGPNKVGRAEASEHALRSDQARGVRRDRNSSQGADSVFTATLGKASGDAAKQESEKEHAP